MEERQEEEQKRHLLAGEGVGDEAGVVPASGGLGEALEEESPSSKHQGLDHHSSSCSAPPLRLRRH